LKGPQKKSKENKAGGRTIWYDDCMFGLSIWELVIIAAIILVVFGARRLPGLGKALGETVREVKGWKAEEGAEGEDESLETGGSTKASKSNRLFTDINELTGLRTTQGKLRLLSRFFRR
jgi:sec-independent protein translocase protein TatA